MKPKMFICLLNLLSKIVPAGSLESFLGKVRGRGGGLVQPFECLCTCKSEHDFNGSINDGSLEAPCLALIDLSCLSLFWGVCRKEAYYVRTSSTPSSLETHVGCVPFHRNAVTSLCGARSRGVLWQGLSDERLAEKGFDCLWALFVLIVTLLWSICMISFFKPMTKLALLEDVVLTRCHNMFISIKR